MSSDKNPLSVEEDYYLDVKDVRPVGQPISGSQTQEQEDIQYLLKNLYAALKIPKEYLKDGS